MPYVPPEDVMASPGSGWTWERTLYNSGESGWSVAEGRWGERPALVIRWNGRDNESAPGFPNRGKYATWFIVPEELEDAVRLAVRIAALEKGSIIWPNNE